MSKILRNLNPDQKNAVMAENGPILILAGAGSGKTRTLAHRFAYLIESGVKQEDILALTFTNKAATEMAERVIKLLDKKTGKFYMGTFHSVCARILRQEIPALGYSRNFSIYDRQDQLETVKQAMKDLGYSLSDYNTAAVLRIISSAKNHLISPKDYSPGSKNDLAKATAEIYPRYQGILQASDALDFDDLIMKMIELLKTNKTIRERYQRSFAHILVDEYQDTNHAQYSLLKTLAEKHRNIFVVGDDWQSIYKFRNADIRNILEFEKDYPEAKVFKLEQNYRSTKNILSAAHAVIVANKNQKQKKLWTENENGDKVVVYEAQDQRDEGYFVASEIKKLVQNQARKRYRDFAVLYRTHAQSRAVEEAFIKHNVPYQIIGGLKFYDRKEIKDIISYLKLLLNPKDLTSFARIINVPPRKVGRRSIEMIVDYARKNDLDYLTILKNAGEISGLHAIAAEGLVKVGKMYSVLRKKTKTMPLDKFISYVVEESGYGKWIIDGSEEGETRMENIKELLTVAKNYNRQKPEERLRAFLEDVALLSEVDTLEDKDNSVVLTTVHQAKGLEFPVVFIVGLEENLFPHSRSLLDESEMEEECRLCYVATTRAKHRLYLLHARMREYFGKIDSNPRSRFIDSIPAELITNDVLDSGSEEGDGDFYEEKDNVLACGDIVRHAAFGQGTVVEIDDNIITVDFGLRGIKKLAKEYAPIEKL